jgi:hypothetical protein
VAYYSAPRGGPWHKVRIGCHTFPATGVTAYLNAGGTLENAQPWPLTKARVQRNSMTAPVMKSRSMTSSVTASRPSFSPG